MRRLVLRWLTILNDKTPVEIIVYALLSVAVLVIVFFMVRGGVAIWRYTPDSEAHRGSAPRPPKPTAPRAAGAKPRRVA